MPTIPQAEVRCSVTRFSPGRRLPLAACYLPLRLLQAVPNPRKSIAAVAQQAGSLGGSGGSGCFSRGAKDVDRDRILRWGALLGPGRRANCSSGGEEPEAWKSAAGGILGIVFG